MSSARCGETARRVMRFCTRSRMSTGSTCQAITSLATGRARAPQWKPKTAFPAVVRGRYLAELAPDLYPRAAARPDDEDDARSAAG